MPFYISLNIENTKTILLFILIINWDFIKNEQSIVTQVGSMVFVRGQNTESRSEYRLSKKLVGFLILKFNVNRYKLTVYKHKNPQNDHNLVFKSSSYFPSCKILSASHILSRTAIKNLYEFYNSYRLRLKLGYDFTIDNLCGANCFSYR